MIWVLIVIAIMLFWIGLTIRNTNLLFAKIGTEFVKWGNADLRQRGWIK